MLYRMGIYPKLFICYFATTLIGTRISVAGLSRIKLVSWRDFAHITASILSRMLPSARSTVSSYLAGGGR